MKVTTSPSLSLTSLGRSRVAAVTYLPLWSLRITQHVVNETISSVALTLSPGRNGATEMRATDYDDHDRRERPSEGLGATIEI